MSTCSRLVLGLGCLLVSTILLASTLGLLPSQRSILLQTRASQCELLAAGGASFLGAGNIRQLEVVLRTMVARHEDIVSAGLRGAQGNLVLDVNEHDRHWRQLPADCSIETHVQVPIRVGNERWGSVELTFQPPAQGLARWLQDNTLRLTAFVTASCCLLFSFYLRRTLVQLNPNQAVPGHVRAALDTLAEGLLVVDRGERMVLANQAFADVLGISPEKLVGHRPSQFRWLDQQGCRLRGPYPWQQLLKGQNATGETFLRLADVQGEIHAFKVNCSPVLAPNGSYRGVLVSLDDVTQIEAQKGELERARTAAEAANQAKSSFLANMSHEIRTPMNAILGFADVLRRGLAQGENEQRRYLSLIHSSGEHLLNLINDILDLSKVEAGRLEVERTPTRPHSIIHEVVAVLNVKAQEKGLELAFESDGPLPEIILSDALRLRQILTNLVGNALKFTKQGKVTVRARLHATPGAEQLILQVIDTGVGISEQAIEKIFDPFTQADNSVVRNFGGTGLGLTISRRFAEALGGSLTATSQLGKGSTFTLVLPTGPLAGVPLLTAEEAAVKAQSASVERTGTWKRPRSGKILLVDDGEANRLLISLVLSRVGVRVTQAENGQVALDRMAEENFDLVLMDMQMPVMDGYTATRRLREQGVQIPIVALTANAMVGDEEKCRAAGCSGFLSKPVNLDQLMDLVLRELGEAMEGSAEPPAGSLPEAAAAAAGEPAGDDATGPVISSLWDTDDEMRAIVAGYVTKLRGQLPLIVQASREQNWSELAKLAHWLKGSAGTVGFAPLTEPARALEAAAKQCDVAETEAALRVVVRLVDCIALPGMSSAPAPLLPSVSTPSLNTPLGESCI